MRKRNQLNAKDVVCRAEVYQGSSWTRYSLWLLAALCFALFSVACGDGGGGKYGRANNYEGCMAQCDEANECGAASNCSVTCAMYHLEALGYLTGPQRECMRGMGEYYACVGEHCSVDEEGMPHYDEEGMQECEPISEKYEPICDAASE